MLCGENCSVSRRMTSWRGGRIFSKGASWFPVFLSDSRQDAANWPSSWRKSHWLDAKRQFSWGSDGQAEESLAFDGKKCSGTAPQEEEPLPTSFSRRGRIANAMRRLGAGHGPSGPSPKIPEGSRTSSSAPKVVAEARDGAFCRSEFPSSSRQNEGFCERHDPAASPNVTHYRSRPASGEGALVRLCSLPSRRPAKSSPDELALSENR